ncbi:hypothetical protein BDP27DRAFT_249444 [Rhodocollybia butyracea]|uniref:Uncharacterized protein n=1 Tax=Rhodocollybia butyracea TaxID=206335 RepID=A0A9P5PCV3_9AGAR|nr:hypothetical protein BDP27DRAFT_249444 [Rhodocollybia butyracea]
MSPPNLPRNSHQAHELDSNDENQWLSWPIWAENLALTQDVGPSVNPPVSSITDNTSGHGVVPLFSLAVPLLLLSNHPFIAFEPSPTLTLGEHPSDGEFGLLLARISRAQSRDLSSTKSQKGKGRASSRSSSLSAKPAILPSLAYSSSGKSSFLDFIQDQASLPQREDDEYSCDL